MKPINDVYLYSVGWKGSVARGVRGLYRTNCSDQLDGDLCCEQLFIMLCMEYVCGVSNSGPIVQCMLPCMKEFLCEKWCYLL